MEERIDEHLKGQNKTKIIGIDHIVVLEEALINMMNKQIMKKYPNHDYKVSQSLDCGSNKFVMLKQNYVDSMI